MSYFPQLFLLIKPCLAQLEIDLLLKLWLVCQGRRKELKKPSERFEPRAFTSLVWCSTIWAFTIQSFQKESHLPRSIFSKIFSATYWKDFSFVANFFHNDKRILCSAGFGVYSPKKLEVDRGRQFYFNESTKSFLSSFFCCPRKSGFLWVTWNLTEHFYSIHKNLTLFAF